MLKLYNTYLNLSISIEGYWKLIFYCDFIHKCNHALEAIINIHIKAIWRTTTEENSCCVGELLMPVIDLLWFSNVFIMSSAVVKPSCYVNFHKYKFTLKCSVQVYYTTHSTSKCFEVLQICVYHSRAQFVLNLALCNVGSIQSIQIWSTYLINLVYLEMSEYNQANSYSGYFHLLKLLFIC